MWKYIIVICILIFREAPCPTSITNPIMLDDSVQISNPVHCMELVGTFDTIFREYLDRDSAFAEYYHLDSLSIGDSLRVDSIYIKPE